MLSFSPSLRRLKIYTFTQKKTYKKENMKLDIQIQWSFKLCIILSSSKKVKMDTIVFA